MSRDLELKIRCFLQGIYEFDSSKELRRVAQGLLREIETGPPTK